VAADPWGHSAGNKVDRVDDTGGLMGPIARQAVLKLIAFWHMFVTKVGTVYFIHIKSLIR
jgi:hypothetical protein